MNREIDRILKKHDKVDDLAAGEIVHRLVLTGIDDRAGSGRITGDWIVYGKHEGLNYYLALATHEQAFDPDAFLDFLKVHAADDFPFIFG